MSDDGKKHEPASSLTLDEAEARFQETIARADAHLSAVQARLSKRQMGPARTGDTQTLVSQGVTVMAGERVATPIAAPTMTDLKVVLSPETQAAAQAAQAGGQSSDTSASDVDEESVGAEGEDIEDIGADVEDDNGADDWFASGDTAPSADADTDDASDLVDHRPFLSVSPPDAEDKRLAADLHRGKWRRYATIAALPIVLAALIAVVLWQSMPIQQPVNIVKLVRQGRLDEAQAVVDKAVAESQSVAPPSPISDVAVATFIPDAVVGEIVNVAGVEENAPVVVQTELPSQPLWRPAEIEVASLTRREPSTTPPIPDIDLTDIGNQNAPLPLQVEATQAGVVPTTEPVPARIASAKVGVVPQSTPSPSRGEGRVRGAKAASASPSPSRGEGGVRSNKSPLASTAVAPPPSPPPTPVASVGLVPGAIYEVYDNADGTSTFKCVRGCK
ncbi:hypothetical protein HY546_00320 [archaeon]|nr:hypothetical protein [archaeon]